MKKNCLPYGITRKQANSSGVHASDDHIHCGTVDYTNLSDVVRCTGAILRVGAASLSGVRAQPRSESPFLRSLTQLQSNLWIFHPETDMQQVHCGNLHIQGQGKGFTSKRKTCLPICLCWKYILSSAARNLRFTSISERCESWCTGQGLLNAWPQLARLLNYKYQHVFSPRCDDFKLPRTTLTEGLVCVTSHVQHLTCN